MSETRFASYTTRRGYFMLPCVVLITACVTAACRPTPTTPAVSADTVAVVDGKAITQQDVDRAYRRSQGTAQTLSNEEVLTAKLNLLNDLILQEILLAKGSVLKLEVAQPELDTAYADARKNIPDDAFQQELARRNLTPADMREGLRRELLTQKVLDHEVGSRIAVTDQEVTDFFDANRAQFNVAEESYHLAQIVVTPVREAQVANSTGDDAATPQAAAAKVKMLMERLKAGASFRDLALQYLRGPGVGAARRRPGLRGRVEAAAGASATARRGAQQEPRERERGGRRRGLHTRAGGRPRAGRPARPVNARAARAHLRDASRAEGATPPRGVPHRHAERRGSGQLPGAPTGRVEGAGARGCAHVVRQEVAAGFGRYLGRNAVAAYRLPAHHLCAGLPSCSAKACAIFTATEYVSA